MTAHAIDPRPDFSIALVGNPNCGKTALFNLLTGARQKVANYAGVTVERKVGSARLRNGQHVSVIDLPGAYSLVPTTPDERVTLEMIEGRRAGEAWHESRGQVPDQQRVENMQNKIHGAVARRVVSPEPVFEPVRAVSQRPIVGLFRVRPELEQRRLRHQRIAGKHVVIVPNEIAAERRSVRKPSRDRDDHRPNDGPGQAFVDLRSRWRRMLSSPLPRWRL